MIPACVLLASLSIGLLAGLRCAVPVAIVAWAAHAGWLRLQGTPLAFLGAAATMGLFSLFAVTELVIDKLPSTPNRTRAGGLIPRFALGALAGAAIAAAGTQPLALGAALSGAGGVTGAFAGYQLRTRVMKALKSHDFVVAALEDVLAIGGSLLLVSRSFP